MLFKSRFHEAIRSGAVTLTIRSWKSPRVKPGGRYRFGVRDVLEVDSIEQVPLGTIGPADAGVGGLNRFCD